MLPDELSTRLERLAQTERPVVARFGQGTPLAGAVALLPSAFNPPTFAHLGLLELGARYGHPAALLSTRNVDKALHGASLYARCPLRGPGAGCPQRLSGW